MSKIDTQTTIKEVDVLSEAWARRIDMATRQANQEPINVSLLQEADNIINGERQDMYGFPEDSFAIIAGYWNVFLNEMLRQLGVTTPLALSSLDAANMMVLFKQARKLGQRPCRDNYVDAAGYEGIAGDRLLSK